MKFKSIKLKEAKDVILSLTFEDCKKEEIIKEFNELRNVLNEFLVIFKMPHGNTKFAKEGGSE